MNLEFHVYLSNNSQQIESYLQIARQAIQLATFLLKYGGGVKKQKEETNIINMFIL